MRNPDIQPVESHKTACVGEKTAELLEFNVNYRILVRLTDHGRAVHKRQWDERAAGMPFYPAYEAPSEDAEGWSEWTTWVLMDTFGGSMGPWNELPFETTVRFKSNDMEAVKPPPPRLSPRLQRAFDRNWERNKAAFDYLRDNGD